MKKEKPKWKSDYAMTDGQLCRERDDFGDTAPAFEEVEDAFKAGAHAFECSDHERAPARVDSAHMTLPQGALTERYDELGNRYQPPVYCLVPPTSVTEDEGHVETGYS